MTASISRVALNPVVEAEISRHPWADLRVQVRFAERIPHELRALLTASSPDEAGNAYWRLDNSVVVQGTLFESSVATTKVLVAALKGSDLKPFVLSKVLELVFQLVAGDSNGIEVVRGVTSYRQQCRLAAREGIEVLRALGKEAREIIELLDDDEGGASCSR